MVKRCLENDVKPQFDDLKTSCLHGSCFNGQGAQASTDLHQTLGCTAQAVDAAKVPGETLTGKRDKAGTSTCKKLEKFSDCCANWLMWSELNWIELVWCIGVDNSTGSSSRTDAKTGLRRKHLFLPICGTIHCIPPAAFSGRLACEKQHTHTHSIHYCTSHLWWQQKGFPKHPKASWRVGYSSSKLHYHWQDASHLKCI